MGSLKLIKEVGKEEIMSSRDESLLLYLPWRLEISRTFNCALFDVLTFDEKNGF